MTLDHPTEERLLHALRSYFGYADDQIEFAWKEQDGVHEVALFTYNPRHTHRFLFPASGSSRLQALQAGLHADPPGPELVHHPVAGRWRNGTAHQLFQRRQHPDGTRQVLRRAGSAHGTGVQRRPQPHELAVRDAFPRRPGRRSFQGQGSKFHGYAFPSPSTMRRLRRKPSSPPRGSSAGPSRRPTCLLCLAIWPRPPPRCGRWRTRWQRRRPDSGVLRAHDLHWSLAVVRYFGG